MNAVIETGAPGQRQLVADTGRMSTQEVLRHVTAVQEVMKAVMKPEVHFGKIPGTDKPTLLQPGADVLCMAFHIAPQFGVEDLSTGDKVRYRVTCTGVHQSTGMVLGAGLGECSSGEEKYKWRKATGKAEWESTPPNLRRTKYGKGYNVDQIRTEPEDVANTVLKMASKRAKVAMVLNVLAVSDMFNQDLEELDAALREQFADEGVHPAQPAGPPTWPAEAFASQFPRWEKAVQAGLKTVDDILTLARSKGALTLKQEAQIKGIKVPAKAEEPAPATADAGGEVVDDEFVAQMEAAEGGAQ